MSNNDNLAYCRREFLNKPGYHSVASILAEVRNNHDSNVERLKDAANDAYSTHAYSPEATLIIADCDRRVSMDFNYGSTEAHENNIHKLTTLIDTLTEMRDVLETAQDAYLEDREKVTAWNELRKRMVSDNQSAREELHSIVVESLPELNKLGVDVFVEDIISKTSDSIPFKAKAG